MKAKQSSLQVKHSTFLVKMRTHFYANLKRSIGILASANRGLVHVDDINLLESDIVMSLLQSIHDGRVLVEREGMSVRYPCKPILCATFNSDDAEFKDFFKGGNSFTNSRLQYVLTTIVCR
jgi:predicted ATPase with chaperone activity